MLFSNNMKNMESNDHRDTVEEYIRTAHLSNRKERVMWIDICKGIAIILIVLGNISTIPSALRACIFSFHIPLFMILNGYLIKEYSIKETFVSSIKALIKPYIVICLLAALLAAFCATEVDEAGKILFHSLDNMIVGMSGVSTMYGKYDSVGIVWFVCCLFLSRNLYVLVCHCCEKKPFTLRIVMILIIAFAGCYTGLNLAFLPWSLDVAMASVVFIAFGDYLRTHSFKQHQKYIVIVVAFICWIFLLYKRAWIELATRSYKYDVVCFVCAISGSVVMIALSKGLARIPCFSRGKSLIAWAGKNSMLILGVHCIEMRLFDWKHWVYEPLNIAPSWFAAFLLHITFILTVTHLFNRSREKIRLFNSKLRNKSVLKAQPARMDWPDVAKGICILSVILGHQGISWINRIVFVYHLPVFYIIAGYFLKKTDNLQFAKAKARRLLVPYAVTSAIICLLSVYVAWLYGLSTITALFSFVDAALYGAGLQRDTPFHINSIGAIWFLWAMFFACIIVNYIVEKKYYHIMLVSIAFVGWSSFNATDIWLPLSIQAGMLACVYLLIGYECRKNEFAITKIDTLPLLGLCLLTAFGIQRFKGIWLVNNYFGNGIFDFFVTIASSFVIFSLSEYICRTSEWLIIALSYLGKNSLIILCAHFIDLNALHIRNNTMYYVSYLHLNNNHTYLLSIFVCIIFTVLVAAAFNIEKKTRFKKNGALQ